MEMLTPPALVLSLSKLVHGGRRILAAFAAIIMAGSIVLTLSRGGVISLVAELLILRNLGERRRHAGRARTRIGPPLRFWVQDIAGGSPRAVTPEGIDGLFVSVNHSDYVSARDMTGTIRLYPIDGGEPKTVIATRPQLGRNGRILQRWHAYQSQRTGSGLHFVSSIDVVFKQDRDSVQRTSCL
jgi:hypothetical protein